MRLSVGFVHCSRNSQISFFSKIFIRNGSYNTIYIFKNYFTSVLVFNNIQYPNRYLKKVAIKSMKSTSITQLTLWCRQPESNCVTDLLRIQYLCRLQNKTKSSLVWNYKIKKINKKSSTILQRLKEAWEIIVKKVLAHFSPSINFWFFINSEYANCKLVYFIWFGGLLAKLFKVLSMSS